MRIALFLSQTDNVPKPLEVSWEDLKRKLLSHKRTDCNPCPGKDCPKKFGAAWSPADYAENTTRGAANVRTVTAAVFDLEGPGHTPLSAEQMGAVARAVDGLRYVCHSTHSGGCYRLVVALSRPVTPIEWDGLFPRLVAAFELPADLSARDVSRLFFFPSAPDGAEVIAESAEGEPLDVEKFLSAASVSVAGCAPDAGVGALAHPTPAPSFPAPPPTTAAAGPVDLEPARTALKRQRKPRSKELAQKILSGAPLGVPGGSATEPGRDDAVNAAAALVATAPPEILPEEAAIELLRPSIAAMACDPEGLDYWLNKAAYSYRRAVARRQVADARAAEDRNAVLEACGIDPSNPNPNSPLAEGEAGGEDWRQGFLLAKDIAGNIIGPKACEANVALILENDAEWKGVLRFNEVTKDIDVFGGPLLGKPKATLETEALVWLQRSAYKLSLKPAQVGSVMLMVARRNSYDPLADYLNGLTWDGTARIHRWLHDYGGAAEDLHTERVARRWFIAAVARGLRPGCKVDNVLILEGKQGKNKSQALDVLGNPFFTDAKIHVHDKDSKLLASRQWIIELGELASFSKADAEHLKQFFSQREDQLRPPYGRVIENFQRRCVFVGTTNKDEYLQDPTGNRRYWPVRIQQFDLERLKQDRDQLWAEAVVAYKSGESWWLSGEEAEVAEKVAQERAAEVAYQHTILNWWLSKEVDKRPGSVTVQEIADDALNLAAGQQNSKVRMDIGVALKALGFEKKRVRQGGVLVWVSVPPEHLRTASQVKRGGTSLAAVIEESIR